MSYRNVSLDVGPYRVTVTGMAKQGSVRLDESEWALVKAYQERIADRNKVNVSMNDALASLVRIGLAETTRERKGAK